MYFETSAKLNQGVEEMFGNIAKKLVDSKTTTAEPVVVKLDPSEGGGRAKCCN
jgi:hypothetical protein